MKAVLLKAFKDLNLWAILVLALVMCCQYTQVDYDFWGRLSAASEYLSNGWVLYKDVFAFTDVKPLWVDHEWLSSIIFFMIFKNFGALGILVLKCVFISVELVLIYLCSRLRSDSDKNFFFLLLILLALLPAFISNLRIHDFTYIFFTLWLLILEYSRICNNTKILWIIPLTIPVWVNLHAGCIAGVALVLVYAFSQFIERKEFKIYLLIALISVLLMFVNPYTYNYFLYVISEMTASHNSIEEWNSVELFNMLDFIWFKVLILLTIVLYAMSFKYKKFDPVACILLLAFAYFGFKYARHTILYAIAAGVFLYERIDLIYASLKSEALKIRSVKYINIVEFILNKGLAFFILILFLPTLFLVNLHNWKFTLTKSEYPINIVKVFKKERIKGNVLLPFKWGSFITWSLYPEIKVSVDGRYVEVYPLSTFKENNDFYYAKPGWDDVLKKYNIDYIFVDKLNSPVYKIMLSSKDWKQIYSDQFTVVFSCESNNIAIDNINVTEIPYNYVDSYFLSNDND